MKAFILSFLVAVALAQGPINTSSAGGNSTATPAASTSSSPDYTITAVPVVSALASAAPCVFNCLNPIGLADPSGCDDVSNDCACLSAPLEALNAITECINTVCSTSTSSYASLATALYQSYCDVHYAASDLSSATAADSSSDAAAAASTSSAGASSAASKSGSKTTSATASATSKSAATPARDFTALYVLMGWGLLVLLVSGVVSSFTFAYADDPAGFPRWVDGFWSLFSDPFSDDAYQCVRDDPQLWV